MALHRHSGVLETSNQRPDAQGNKHIGKKKKKDRVKPSPVKIPSSATKPTTLFSLCGWTGVGRKTLGSKDLYLGSSTYANSQAPHRVEHPWWLLAQTSSRNKDRGCMGWGRGQYQGLEAWNRRPDQHKNYVTNTGRYLSSKVGGRQLRARWWDDAQGPPKT